MPTSKHRNMPLRERLKLNSPVRRRTTPFERTLQSAFDIKKHFDELADELSLGFKDEFEKIKQKVDEQLQNTIEQIRFNGERQNQLLERLKLIEGKQGDRGDIGERGKVGETGQSITGEQGVQGEKGLKGDTVVGKSGSDGSDGKDGNDGKDGSSDSPKQVIEKVNKARNKIPISKIMGLDEMFVSLKRTISNISTKKSGGGGGIGNLVQFSFSGDGSTTAFTLSSRVAMNGLAIWCYYNSGWMQPTVHLNVVGTTMTMTFTPANNTTLEGFYIRT